MSVPIDKGKDAVADDDVGSSPSSASSMETIISSEEEYEEETDAPCFSFDQLLKEVPPSLGWPRKSFTNLQEAFESKSSKDLWKVEHPLTKKRRVLCMASFRLETINKSRKEKEASLSALSAMHTSDEKRSVGGQESSKGACLGSKRL